MRRFLGIAFLIALSSAAFAQTTDTSVVITTTRATKQPIQTRSNDHFMIQLGRTTWTNQPDSVYTKGFPRTFNMYLMMDFPFKTNPHFSVAIGPGIATDNIYFDKQYVGIKDNSATVRFQDVKDTNHFKKYKLATAYAEAPVELRYRFNPDDDAKSVKLALGVKVGTLLNAHVKGKDLQNKAGNTVLSYTDKESSKKFFNKNRLSVMARAGYGHFTLFASYAVTPLFKEGLGPQVHPLTFGLTLSGL